MASYSVSTDLNNDPLAPHPSSYPFKGSNRSFPFIEPSHCQPESTTSSALANTKKMQVDYSSSSLCFPSDRSQGMSSLSQPQQPPEKRVPRPRNAFMIFRSAFWAEQKINRTVEHDHRHISRIVGHCWNRMSDLEKDKWRAKAAMEKEEHARRHPDYVFCPTPRSKKPLKRKVKRNGPEDLRRCEKVADLLLMGKQGNDLAEAISAIKLSALDGDDLPASPLSSTSGSSFGDWSGSDFDDPPFRSPLLPPSDSFHATPVVASIRLTEEMSPINGNYGGQQSLPCTPESPSPNSLPQYPQSVAVDLPGISQPFKSALFQIPAGPSASHSPHSVEGFTQFFTHTAKSFNTLDSVGYPTARSPTPALDFYASPQRFPLGDANTVPNPESIYDFPTLPPPRSPEITATIPALPSVKSPAPVTAEPVVFTNPFAP
ncbi:hypothetical protein NMY22_g18684 [Coprinellus aureogranulatus]|nr:hypothetical protein NMY22_g18684 [Coprinellus aureogranulatus]